jgi:hypothetical protein
VRSKLPNSKDIVKSEGPLLAGLRSSLFGTATAIATAALLAIFAGHASVAHADNKLEVSAGAYSLTAKTAKRSGSAASLGIYRLGYSFSFGNQFEFQLAYSLFASAIVTGDLGYGPDLTVLYYPVTDSGGTKVTTEKVVLSVEDVVRPFVTFGFHQRQFQSVDSSYAGFSVGAGAEYAWDPKYGLKGQVRYLMLNGPSAATADQLDILFGISFSL